jgi:outer membrane protein assembly factor BamB
MNPMTTADWPSFGFNARFNPNESVLSPVGAPSLIQDWSYTTGGPVQYSSPAVVNGLVYIGSTDHNLYAFHVP